MTKIAIVTVDYNQHRDTGELLASAGTLDTAGLEISWLVVDNGSDVSVAETVNKFPGVVWIQNGANLGYAGGFNRGLHYAKEWGADYILIINNDTLFGDKNILNNLLEVFISNPSAGLVSPKIYFAPGFEFFKEKYTAKDKGKVVWYAGGKFDWNNIRSMHRGIDEVDTGKYNEMEQTGFISGCCLMVKREVLERAGYLEEKLFAYYEDADWVERIKHMGYEQWYCGTSYIYHKVSQTSGIGSPMTDYLITRNRLWFGLKYAGFKTKFALLREAGKLLLTGRKAQKEGIRDYFGGIWGWKKSGEQEKATYPLELSVVIVNFKSTKLTLQLLKSIYGNKSGYTDIKGGAEVIVLDNSPEESCKPEVLAVYPKTKFIANPVNNGFSSGYNQMIYYSLGKYILMLNCDIEVKPGGIVRLLVAVRKLGDRAIYSGKLSFATDEEQNSCFHLPTARRAFDQYFLNVPGSYFMFSPPGDKPVAVEGVAMACYLIPHRVINELGMLQEATFMYFEDIDYARRAKYADIPIYYVPDAEFIHHHGQASKKAGLDLSNQRLVKASKWYHGRFNYYLLTAVLWAGQKFGRITTPRSKWMEEDN